MILLLIIIFSLVGVFFFMSVNFVFSIASELLDKEPCLVLQCVEKSSGQVLCFSDTRKFSAVDKALVDLIIQASVSSKNENTWYIKGVPSFPLVQKLYASKKLERNGRSLFYNPLSKVSIELDVEEEGSSSLLVSGFVKIDGTLYSLSTLDVFFGGGSRGVSWAICKQILFVMPREIPSSLFSIVIPGPCILEGKQRAGFIEEYKQDPCEGLYISWKEGSSDPLTVFPILVLRDLHGAFADLQMEYGSDTVDFKEAKSFPGRNIEAEKGWEKDLLETDFIRKDFVDSRYYCPLDKVTKSLSFLLDIGWKILDKKGRVLLKVTHSELSLSSQEEGVLVKGTFQYKNHVANLGDVVGAFNRRERFLELSSHAVGWLDETEEVFKGLKDLGEVTKISDGCFFRKKEVGLLGPLSERSDLTSSSRSLIERVSTFSLLETVLEDTLFQGRLHPYQEEGRKWLSFLYQNGFSGLLADEMGLGKTVQTLSFLAGLTLDKPILLIVPTSLVFNWKREWEKFIPHKKLYVHEGPKRFLDRSELQGVEAVITSYAYLRIDSFLLSQVEFSIAVLDEAQWIKNPESQVARAAFMIRAAMKLCLSGTPIENRADDLWSLFRFLEPELLGERKDFLASLSAAEMDGRYKQKIKKLVRPFILRRLKEVVAKDLPEKVEQEIYVEMGEFQRSFYESWLAKAKQGLLQKIRLDGVSKHRMEVLEMILRLRQICTYPSLVEEGQHESAKIEKVLADLEEVLEQNHKVLIYSQFTQVLRLLEKETQKKGWKHVYLDGETKDREKVVSAFQEDPSISLFLISLKAGGVGLNLTAADYVFLLDPWWNEAVERQAIDRAHRFGRKNTVVARRYIMAMTIEEKMMKLKAHKTALARGLLDFEETGDPLALEDLIELITD